MAIAKSTEEQEGLVFRALADSTRRKLLDVLKKNPGFTIADLEPLFSMSRFNVMKHLNVLEEAGIIEREREGNMRKIYLKAEPIKQAQNRCKDWV